MLTKLQLVVKAVKFRSQWIWQAKVKVQVDLGLSQGERLSSSKSELH